jgi:hypothetical protein
MDNNAILPMIDEMVRSGERPDKVIYTQLMDFNIKSNTVDEAINILHKMISENAPADVVVYHVVMRMFFKKQEVILC